MGGYGAGELAQVFTLLRGLRLEAGDFVPEPGAAAQAEPDHDRDRAGTGSP